MFWRSPISAQRATGYWGYLFERYAVRTADFREFSAARGERVWLLLYAPASFLYRVAVMLAIATFVASEYLAVGVAIAAWGLFSGLILPIGKALAHVIHGTRFRNTRRRAVTTVFASSLAAALVLFLVPAPAFTTTEGVVWLPESAIVRAGTSRIRAPHPGAARECREGRRGAGRKRRDRRSTPRSRARGRGSPS